MEVVNKLLKTIGLNVVSLLVCILFYFCYYVIFDLVFMLSKGETEYGPYISKITPGGLAVNFIYCFFYFLHDLPAFIFVILLGNGLLLLSKKAKDNTLISCLAFGFTFLLIPLLLSRPFDLLTFELGRYRGQYRTLEFCLIYFAMGTSYRYIHNIIMKRYHVAAHTDKV